MLGRVFENLLNHDTRKNKGTFYTPRRIVNYMCEQSLINYLTSETKDFIENHTIQDFIKKSKINDLSKGQAELLDNLLKNLKICDPAIGSGAFPMGILSIIVRSRLNLCKLTNKFYESYDLKKYSIINSIFGVDIDPGAVEIAKLRLFLSLVVDNDDINQIDPLPNLDYHIMQGNSLVEDFNGIKLDINQKKFKEICLKIVLK